jgi:hypothetical protein
MAKLRAQLNPGTQEQILEFSSKCNNGQIRHEFNFRHRQHNVLQMSSACQLVIQSVGSTCALDWFLFSWGTGDLM